MSEILENEKIDELFEKMKEAWNAPFVKRQDVGKFSFGVLAPGAVTQADHKGKGIKNSFKLNGYICYPVDDVIEFLKSKLETENSRPEKKKRLRNEILLKEIENKKSKRTF